MDADARGQPPSYRTVISHTGAEFEGNTVTNRNRGERVPGVEPEAETDVGQPQHQQSTARPSAQPGINSFSKSQDPDHLCLLSV